VTARITPADVATIGLIKKEGLMTTAPTPVPGRPAAHRGSWLVLAIVALFAVATLTVILLARSGALSDSSTARGTKGSGVPASQRRDVAPFSAVALAGADTVLIHVGGAQSVVVRGDGDLLDRVTTRVHDGRLAIGTKGSFSSRSRMSVELTVPSLRSLALDGNGVIVVGGIDTPSLTVTLAGSGVIRAGGKATRLDVTLSGVGDAQLGELVAADAYAVLNGSGRITLTATKSLNASVPGSGSIVYGGSPSAVTKSVTGRGTITSG
jgi:hypothetical protein